MLIQSLRVHKSSFFFFAVVSLVLSTLHVAHAQSAEIERISSVVTQVSIEAHVHFLAADELRGRDTPSEGLDAAAAYIASHFRRHGVAPLLPEGYFQKVQLFNTQPADEGRIKLGKNTFDSPEQFLQTGGGNVSITGKVVFVDYGTEADFQSANVKDKVVIARGGKPGSTGARDMFVEGRQKSLRAKEAGALAIIELYNSPQLSWSMMQYYLNSPRMTVAGSDGEVGFPAFWIEDIGNSKLAQLRKEKGSVEINTRGAVKEVLLSQNVVGIVEGTDPLLKNEYVVYSAHYDHVGIGVPDADGDSIYNGTRDNAIGTMTVLEAAAYIATNPTKRSALFILFTGEEKGLLGSEWFVAHPPLSLKDIVFCFNSDNAGYNNTELVTVVGLNRTTAGPLITEAVETFGLTAIDDPEPRQNLFDRSDQANFARVGIPALMYSLGLTAMDEEVLKYYHRPADNPDSVDYEYLHKFTKAYVLAAIKIANMQERPFWIPGDKYFGAGETLYRP